jgi:hypothetical protein
MSRDVACSILGLRAMDNVEKDDLEEINLAGVAPPQHGNWISHPTP